MMPDDYSWRFTDLVGKWLSVSFLILLWPADGVSADTGVEGSVLEYTMEAFAAPRDNPAAGNLFDRAVDVVVPHQYVLQDSWGLVRTNYKALVASGSDGIWRYRAYWDNVLIPNCEWTIETTNAILSPQQRSFDGISCLLTQTQMAGSGTHQFRITRDTLSGTPAAISNEVVSYEILRIDVLEEDMTNEILDAAIVLTPLAMLAAMVVWAEISRSPILYVAAAFIGVLNVAIWRDEPIFVWALLLTTVSVLVRAFLAIDEEDKELFT